MVTAAAVKTCELGYFTTRGKFKNCKKPATVVATISYVDLAGAPMGEGFPGLLCQSCLALVHSTANVSGVATVNI